MSNANIQLIIVLAIVGLAVFFFTRRMVKQVRGKEKAGCDKCGDG